MEQTVRLAPIILNLRQEKVYEIDGQDSILDI
jgi:hypothetical protein